MVIYCTMMIDINKEKLKRMVKRGVAAVLVIGLACGYRVMNPGSPLTKDDAAESSAAMEQGLDWGLSFGEEGQAPVGNASLEELAKYDSWYVGDPENKVIYLTFDAGYENGCTGEILDVLKREKVPAAFFLVGTYMEDNPDLVKRMAEEGHLVGNHTMNHADMTTLTDEAAFLKELQSVEAVYEDITGKKMEKFYRPPQGKFSTANLQMAQKAGYKTIFWSLAYEDWLQDRQPTREEALAKLLPRTHNGAIILLHSTSKTNATVLGELITKWKEEGYQLESLNMLGK